MKFLGGGGGWERATLQELKFSLISKRDKNKIVPEHGFMIIIIILKCKIRSLKNSQHIINCIIAYMPQFSFAMLALYYIQYRADKIVICIAYCRVNCKVQDWDVFILNCKNPSWEDGACFERRAWNIWRSRNFWSALFFALVYHYLTRTTLHAAECFLSPVNR